MRCSGTQPQASHEVFVALRRKENRMDQELDELALVAAHQTAVEELAGRPLNEQEGNLCRGFWDIGFTPEQTLVALGAEGGTSV